MRILELAYNCCENNGTVERYADFCDRLNTLSEVMPSDLQQPIQRIYLGYDFCENMFCSCSVPELEQKIWYAARRGYRVSVVLPIMHQSRVERFVEVIRPLEAQDLLDEWIVNDIGTLLLMRETLGISRPISLGRMFEKGLRETRVDVTEDEVIRRCFEDLQPESGETEELLALVQKYGITGMETDTFPDGILQLTHTGLSFHVHYPDIYLSSAAVCEYEGIGRDRPFTLHPSCSGACRAYGQRIKTARGTVLKKIGNAIFTEQTRPIDACVRGDIRLVYSCRR